MEEKRCETCGYSSEIYKDPDCPYLTCDFGEVVGRWNSCDEWKEKNEVQDRTDRKPNEGDAGRPRRILPFESWPDI